MRDPIKEFFKDKKFYQGEPIPLELYGLFKALKRFFADKTWYCGGPIPMQLIFTERNLKLIDRISLSDAVKIGFRSIHRAKKLAKTTYEVDVPEPGKDCDTQLVLQVMKECARKWIPQDNIGGIFLLYLELCEKVELL